MFVWNALLIGLVSWAILIFIVLLVFVILRPRSDHRSSPSSSTMSLHETSQVYVPVRSTASSTSTPTSTPPSLNGLDGSTVKCKDDTLPDALYQWNQGKLYHYNNMDIAISCDPSVKTRDPMSDPYPTLNCDEYEIQEVIKPCNDATLLKPDADNVLMDGSTVKCKDDTLPDALYQWNQDTLYHYNNMDIAISCDPSVKTRDPMSDPYPTLNCDDYEIQEVIKPCNDATLLKPDADNVLRDGAPIRCYQQSQPLFDLPDAVYQYNNHKIYRYNTSEVAESCDPDWNSTTTILQNCIFDDTGGVVLDKCETQNELLSDESTNVYGDSNIRKIKNRDLCLSLQNKEPQMSGCNLSDENQLWYVNVYPDGLFYLMPKTDPESGLQWNNSTNDAISSSVNDPVQTNALFNFDAQTRHIFPKDNSQYCLTNKDGKVFFTACDPEMPGQKWTFTK